jgi:hypothetical protein
MKSRILRTLLSCSAFFGASVVHASPQDDLAAGQAAVINAIVAGASAHAPQLLAKARASLQMARGSIARDEPERAGQLARQAFAEATEAESRSLVVREASLVPKGRIAAP